MLFISWCNISCVLIWVSCSWIFVIMRNRIWFSLDTWCSYWSIFGSVRSIAWCHFAIFSFWSISSMAFRKIIICCFYFDWCPLPRFLVKMEIFTLHMKETSSWWWSFIPCWFIETWWSVSALRKTSSWWHTFIPCWFIEIWWSISLLSKTSSWWHAFVPCWFIKICWSISLLRETSSWWHTFIPCWLIKIWWCIS